MKIVGEIKLFSYDQDIYILNDDGTIKLIGTTTIENLPDVLLHQCDINNTQNIAIIGPTQFSQNIKEKVEKLALTNFAEKKFTVELIEKNGVR